MGDVDRNHVKGLIAAPFTPMNDDGSVNLAAIGPYAYLLHRNGVAGAFVCGTTGEGISLTPEERLEVARAWVNAAPPGFRVIVHVGHNSLEMAKRFAAHAGETGAWGMGAVGPFYYKPKSAAELVPFCRELAAAAPNLPFYYYHIPSMTGLGFLMADFLSAAVDQIPNLAGIKFTNEDLMDFALCREMENGRFDMLFGRDEMLLGALAVGARGAVGSTYNFAAPLFLRLIEAFDAGDLKTAQDLQLKSMRLVQHLIGQPSGFMSASKSLMKLIGVDCGPVRPPLQRISVEQEQQLQADLEQLGFGELRSQ